MARPESPLKREVIAVIRGLTAKHGIKEGCRLARERYQSVPTGSWGRWRQEAVGSASEQREADGAAVIAMAEDVRAQIPAPEQLALAMADPVPATRRALDFWATLDQLEHDAQLLREFALAKGADGKVRVRVPFALRDAHRMRCDLLRLALQQAEAAWSVERAQSFFDAVVAEVGAESPECQRRIMGRLRHVQSEAAERGF